MTYFFGSIYGLKEFDVALPEVRNFAHGDAILVKVKKFFDEKFWTYKNFSFSEILKFVYYTILIFYSYKWIF